MTAKWKKGFNTGLITDALEAAKRISDAGEMSYEAAGFRNSVAVLSTMSHIRDDIPEIEKASIVSAAAFAAGREGTITPESVLAEMQELEHNFLRRPFKRYVLVTAISSKRSITLRRIRLGSTIIIFENQLPMPFHNSLTEFVAKPELIQFPQPPHEYIRVRVHVSGRSVHDAAARAFSSLDLIRGIWNLYLNRPTLLRSSSGRLRQPVNQLVLGPFHTLNMTNGTLATTNTWWYEPEYQGPVNVFNQAQHLPGMYGFEKQVRSNLHKLTKRGNEKLRNLIEKAIADYSRALDHRNWNASFLQLWQILEDLTFTPKAQYDVTIRRAAFTWTEHLYHKQVLLHLRERRNSFVHENANSDNVETHIYQLKRYVEGLIHFHLANGYRFDNVEDIQNFLDMHPDLTVLKKRSILINRAIRYRSDRRS